MLNWKKPKAKKGKDLFWGLPTGKGSRYPFNEEYDEEFHPKTLSEIKPYVEEQERKTERRKELRARFRPAYKERGAE